MANIRLVAGNWYRFQEQDGTQHVGQYYGREEGFECCVCGKGHNAYAFNIWYDENGGYETWAYGREHLPAILEKVGTAEDIVIDQ